MAACWWCASHFEIRSDVMELLPRGSLGFQAFVERRLERVGGRTTLIVVAESPDRAANERFVDGLREKLDHMHGPKLISSIESGTKDFRAFFDANKWVYANLEDLQQADDKLDHQIAINSGLVSDLSDDADEKAESSLGMDEFKINSDEKSREHGDFPSPAISNPRTARKSRSAFSRRPRVWAAVKTNIAVVLILGGLVWFYGSAWSLVLLGLPPLFGVGCAYAFAT